MELESYQSYRVGKYICSIINNNNNNEQTDIFYYIIGDLIKDYYPDCYNQMLINTITEANTIH